MITATGSQIVIEILKRRGIDMVSGIPGGSILPLYDELTRSGIRHILVRHEQAGGFIAQGIARSTGKTAVCIATSGPGAMNLLTAIADARSDSIPMLAITGQVNRNLVGTDAFQETDTFGLSMPITKHSIMVKSARELLTALPKAFEIAERGRPGPVLVDIPRDVQLERAEFDTWPHCGAESPEKRFIRESGHIHMHSEYEDELQKAIELFSKASRAVIFCGGGTIASPTAPQLVLHLSNQYALPVCTSLMGLGSVPSTHELFCGMVGMHGTYCANKIIYDSDLVIALGVRFDDRATGLVSQFCPKAKIIHIDIDAAEINKIYQSASSLAGDAGIFLQKLLEGLEQHPIIREKKKGIEEQYRTRVTEINEAKQKKTRSYQNTADHPSVFLPRINALFHQINGHAPIITTDVGQHQMFVAQCFPLSFPRQLLTSGSLGTMGFGLPAAIGASLANPQKRVLCFSGDGSILMNIQELATLAECDLDITVIVLDNQCLGMVRQQQELLCNARYSASVYEKNPALVRIAEGFNIPAFDIDDVSQFDTIMQKALSGSGPRFVRIPVQQTYNVYPFVPSGKPNIEAIGILS